MFCNNSVPELFAGAVLVQNIKRQKSTSKVIAQLQSVTPMFGGKGPAVDKQCTHLETPGQWSPAVWCSAHRSRRDTLHLLCTSWEAIASKMVCLSGKQMHPRLCVSTTFHERRPQLNVWWPMSPMLTSSHCPGSKTKILDGQKVCAWWL